MCYGYSAVNTNVGILVYVLERSMANLRAFVGGGVAMCGNWSALTADTALGSSFCQSLLLAFILKAKRLYFVLQTDCWVFSSGTLGSVGLQEIISVQYFVFTSLFLSWFLSADLINVWKLLSFPTPAL